MKSKVFLDTTILADVLLKNNDNSKKANEVLEQATSYSFMMYAVKEFKAGPLNNYVYLYNKLESTGSCEKTMEILWALSRTQHKYKLSTSLEAITLWMNTTGPTTNEELTEKYGKTATLEQMRYDSLKETLKAKIFLSCKRITELSSKIVEIPDCYKLEEPILKKGLIQLGKLSCEKDSSCCLIQKMLEHLDSVSMLKAANEALDQNTERTKRTQILKDIVRGKSLDFFSDKECRQIGDAMFAFFCPEDATILTTNIKDHKPLAESLQKTAATPDDWLEKNR